jgi:hypothetical protein
MSPWWIVVIVGGAVIIHIFMLALTGRGPFFWFVRRLKRTHPAWIERLGLDEDNIDDAEKTGRQA